MLRARCLLLCVTLLGCQTGPGGGGKPSPPRTDAAGGGAAGGGGGAVDGGAGQEPGPARDGGGRGGTGAGGGRADASSDGRGGAGGAGGSAAADGATARDQGAAPPADGASAPPATPHPVFHTATLHRIEITVASQHLAQLDRFEQTERVPCNIVVDGTSLPSSGIRTKGGKGSWRPLAQKAPFSIKFNQFVMGQKLGGLSKLLLNNAIQDPSFLNEHLVYEIARRVGAAGPLTAHAAVTFNGQPYGFFVVREAINDDFLRRTFGKDNEDGNLYEGGEFVKAPHSPELKDEVEEMRSRADLREVSALINNTPDPEWIAVVGTKLDIPSFLTGYALESLIDHWDGYFFGPHNYFVYNHPGTGRFLFILGGADSILGRTRQPELDPKVLLAQKFLQFPQTRTQLHTRLTEIARGLDVPAMHARIDEVARILRSYKGTDDRSRTELAAFEAKVSAKKTAMTAIKAFRPTGAPPATP